ncbi:hypothetical protein QQ045_003337 [Rhodiola kirilowii]
MYTDQAASFPPAAQGGRASTIETGTKLYISNLEYGVSIEDIKLLEEEETEIPIVKEPTKEVAKMDTAEVPAEAATSTTSSDVNMDDVNATAYPSAENGVPESVDKPIQMEMDTKSLGLQML